MFRKAAEQDTNVMKRRTISSLVMSTLCLVLVTSAWALGAFGAAKNATLLLYLEVALKEPTPISRTRYKVFLLFGADPSHRFEEFGGATLLDRAVDRRNMYAIRKFAPMVNDRVFVVALRRACSMDDPELVSELVQLRTASDFGSQKDPCAHLFDDEETERG
jgi:hypothetical protein